VSGAVKYMLLCHHFHHHRAVAVIIVTVVVIVSPGERRTDTLGHRKELSERHSPGKHKTDTKRS